MIARTQTLKGWTFHYVRDAGIWVAYRDLESPERLTAPTEKAIRAAIAKAEGK